MREDTATLRRFLIAVVFVFGMSLALFQGNLSAESITFPSAYRSIPEKFTYLTAQGFPTEHALAILNAEGVDVGKNHITVKRFRYLLNHLAPGITLERERAGGADDKLEPIGLMIVVVYGSLNENGVDMTLLAFTERVNDETPLQMLTESQFMGILVQLVSLLSE